MSVIKTIDLVGVSEQSWREAAQAALQEAAKTLRGISGAHVVSMSAQVEDGRISEFRTTVDIAFGVES